MLAVGRRVSRRPSGSPEAGPSTSASPTRAGSASRGRARAPRPGRGFGDSTMWLIDPSGATRTRDAGRAARSATGWWRRRGGPGPTCGSTPCCGSTPPGTVACTASAPPDRSRCTSAASPWAWPRATGGATGLLSRPGPGTAAGHLVARSIGTPRRPRGHVRPGRSRLSRTQASNLEWPVTVVPVLDTRDRARHPRPRHPGLRIGAGRASTPGFDLRRCRPAGALDAPRVGRPRRPPCGRARAGAALARVGGAGRRGSVSRSSSQPVTMPPLSSSVQRRGRAGRSSPGGWRGRAGSMA